MLFLAKVLLKFVLTAIVKVRIYINQYIYSITEKVKKEEIRYFYMRVIISTFGVAPGGIIQGIIQNGCEKLILLVPKDLKSQKNLKEIEKKAKQMEIRVEKVMVSPYSLMENIEKIKQLLRKNDDVILNVTGGRKPLSLAATLAGFVANPKRIIYIQEENNRAIEIPKFTLYDKVLSKEKRTILKNIKNNMTIEDIKKSLKNEDGMSKNYHVLMKHLRELAEFGLIQISNGRPHTFNILPSGELLR